MVGKQISGKSFGGCIRYILNRDKAFVLDAEGLRVFNVDTIIQDLNIQRKLNLNLGKAVGHLILSWSKEDIDKLDSDLIADIAKQYLQGMKINNTQFITVLHTDREHPHVHIVYNRVNNQGKTISDSNNYKQNVKICKGLTLKYGFHFGEGKNEVHRDRLKGKEQIRYHLYDAIKTAVKQARNWQMMAAALAKDGIGIEFKLKSGTKEVQGVSFSQGEIKMKGSAIDRSCSYKNLNDAIEENTLAKQLKAAINSANQNTETFSTTSESTSIESASLTPNENCWLGLLEDMGNGFGSYDEDDAKRKRQRGMGR